MTLRALLTIAISACGALLAPARSSWSQEAAPAVSQPAASQPAGVQAPAAVQAIVTTVDDEQVSGPIAGIGPDELRLASDPPRTLAVSDILRIELGKLAIKVQSDDLQWIGQDNQDLVQVGGASGGNGVQDLHLHAKNLKSLGIKQIVVTCKFPKRVRIWRLDTSLSPHWRLAIVRSELATEAELYIEPDSLDSYEQTFEVTYTYADGSTAKSNVTATTHTSDQRKLEGAAQAAQPPGASAPGPAGAAPSATAGASKADVFLADGSRLSGEIRELGGEFLTLKTQWHEAVQLPLVPVRGLWFGQPHAAGRAEFDKQHLAPAGEDVIFLLAQDKTAAQVQGSVRNLRDGRLTVHFEGADRTVKQDRLLGIVFAAQAKAPPPEGTYQVFRLLNGDALSGKWQSLADGQFEVETNWKARVKVPVAQVAEILTRNGKLTYLSDLDPSTVEETPYFDRKISWRRDRGFGGDPARVKGRQIAHCVAMHSRSVLTYELDGQYDRFKCTLAFDDSAGTRGRVACRLLVDGNPVFVQKDFRSTQDALQLDVPLSGARQLTLEVDFGGDEDTGDRILWADPRLFRASISGAAEK